MNSITLGRQGENFAVKYLVKEKYRILGRNFRKPWGELDIIAKALDGTLVFCEVKTMKAYLLDGLKPEDQMSPAKRKKFERVAIQYAGAHPELINEKKGWRLDLIAIQVRSGSFFPMHYENI